MALSTEREGEGKTGRDKKKLRGRGRGQGRRRWEGVISEYTLTCINVVPPGYAESGSHYESSLGRRGGGLLSPSPQGNTRVSRGHPCHLTAHYSCLGGGGKRRGRHHLRANTPHLAFDWRREGH